MLNKIALLRDIVNVISTHTAGLSQLEKQALSSKFWSDLFAFAVQVVTTGNGTFGPEKETGTISLLGRQTTFTAEEKITASSVGGASPALNEPPQSAPIAPNQGASLPADPGPAPREPAQVVNPLPA